MVKQVTEVLLILSNAGFAHNTIGLEALYFPIRRGKLSFEYPLKVGGFANCSKIDQK